MAIISLDRLGGSGKDWTIVSESGAVAVPFDVFINMDFGTENPVVQAPTEQGGFAMYNKVGTPGEIGLQVAVMGEPSYLQSAINALNTLASGTQLVNVITPEMEYKGYNIEKLQYQRKAEEGVDVIYIDIGLVEVRQVSTQYTNAKVAKRQSRGRQQAKETSMIEMIRRKVF